MLYNYWQRHTCNIPLYETATRRQLATIITAAAQQPTTQSHAASRGRLLTLDMVTGTEQSLAPCLDSEAGSTDLPGHCPWSAALEDTAETARHHWAESHFHYYFAGFSRNQHGGGRYES